MSLQERIDHADALVKLIKPGEGFGAGQAVCADANPELFFPVSEHDTTRIAAAKSVCQSCPLQGACLHYAVRAGEEFGIWGGLTPEERRRVRLLRREDADETTEEVAA